LIQRTARIEAFEQIRKHPQGQVGAFDAKGHHVRYAHTPQQDHVLFRGQV